MKNNVIFCTCHSVEHLYIFRYDEDSNNIYVSTYLESGNLWKRLIQGVKHIFGYKSTYGDFDTFLVDNCNVEELKEVLNQIKLEK